MSNCLLVHGDEPYLVDQEVKQWLNAARAKAAELGVEMFDNVAKLDQVRVSLTEVPMFDPERFILLRDPAQLTERVKRKADNAELLAKLIEQRAPTTSVCIAVRSKVATTNKVLQTVARMGGKISFHPSVKGRDVRVYVESRLRERKLRLEVNAITYLLKTVGGNIGALEQELNKLAAYSKELITLSEVQRLVAGEEEVQVWAVIERLLSKPPAAGAAAVEQLLENGTATQYLLATLAGQLRDLLLAQELLLNHRGGASMLAREMRVPPWRAERLVRHTSAVSGLTLRAWLSEIQKLDAATKQGLIDDEDTLRIFALKAARQVLKGPRQNNFGTPASADPRRMPASTPARTPSGI